MIGVIAVLLGLVLPALAGARKSAQGVRCLSNLRSVSMLCRAYADDHRGVSPAIGYPYDAVPNWGLVVQSLAGHAGATREDLFRARSVLVCPIADALLGPGMTRTYAMNATGHAGPTMADPDDYDARPAFVRLDVVTLPSRTPLFIDSTRTPNAPPTRTASVIDFRQPTMVRTSLGAWHGTSASAPASNVAMADGSSSPTQFSVQNGSFDVPELWKQRLP